MSAPLGIGQAVLGMVDAERQKRDLASAAQGAAQMFDSLGTPNAKSYAELLRNDPRGAYTLAKQVGGMHQLIALEQANAGRQRAAQATAGFESGSPEQLRAVGDFAFQEGELGVGVQAHQLARPGDADDPLIREFKVGDRIVTKQFDPATSTWQEVATGPRFAPGQSEEITVGPDGTTIRRGTFKQVADEAERGADVDGILENIDELVSLTQSSPGTVGDPAVLGEFGGRVGHTARQFGLAGKDAAAEATSTLSGGSTPEDIAQSITLQQSIRIGSRSWLADKGNLNKDERADLGKATGADAWTPENRIASLRTLTRIGLAKEIRRRRGIGQPHPLDPQVNPGGLIAYMRERGYSDAEIEAMDDRLQ